MGVAAETRPGLHEAQMPTVVVLEDEPLERTAIEDALDEFHINNPRVPRHAIITGSSIKQVTDKFDEHAVDQVRIQPVDPRWIQLVILDLELETTTGTRTIKAVKELHWPNAKILVVASPTGGNFHEDTLQAGADDILQKPFELTEFDKKVNELLTKVA